MTECKNFSRGDCISEEVLQLSSDRYPIPPACPIESRYREGLCKYYEPKVTVDPDTCKVIISLVMDQMKYSESEVLIEGYRDGYKDALQRVIVEIHNLLQYQ